MDQETKKAISENMHWDSSINDLCPHGVCIIHVLLDDAGEPMDWEFEYCNEALARIEGFSVEELQGSRFFELFPNGDRKWLPRYYKAAYEGQYGEYDDISEEIDLYLHVEAIPMKQKGYCLCVLYDIREDVYEKARKSKELEAALYKLSAEKRILDQLCTDFTATYDVDLSTGAFDVLHV